MAFELLTRLKEKALLKLGQIASNPALNTVAEGVESVIRPAAQKGLFGPIGQFASNSPQMQQAGQLIQKVPDTTINFQPKFKPLGAGNPSPINAGPFVSSLPGNIIQSWGRTMERLSSEAGKRDLARGTKELFTTRPGLHTLDNPAVEAAFDVSDTLPGGILFGLGAKTLAREGGERLLREGAEKGLKKIKVPGVDEFLGRVGKTLDKADEVEEVVSGIKLDIADATAALKSSEYSPARLLSDAHEWFSRGSKSFDSEKFIPAMARYVDELGHKTVRKVFDKYANATEVASDSKTRIWKELNELITPGKTFEAERLDSLVRSGDEVAETIHTMPDGSKMAGPEHPGAIPGSTEVGAENVISGTDEVRLLSDKFTPQKVAETKSSVVQAYATTVDKNIANSLNSKGRTWEDLVNQIEGGNIEPLLKDEAKAVTDFLNTVNDAGDIKYSKRASSLSNYFPHRSERQIDEVLDFSFGQSIVDASYLERRTGSMTEYAKDGRVLQRYVAEALGSDDVIRIAEKKVAQTIANKVRQVTEALPSGKKSHLDVPKVDFIDNVQSGIPYEGPRVSYRTGETKGALARGAEGLFRSVDERVASTTSSIYNDFLDPFKKAQAEFTQFTDVLIKKVPDEEIRKLYLSRFGSPRAGVGRKEMIERLSFTKKKEAMAKAINIFTDNVKKADFPEANVKVLVNDIANEYIVRDISEGISSSKVLGQIRSWTGRGALGFNVSSGINNVLELRRALATVSVKASGRAHKRLLQGENLLAKYGIESRLGTALERGRGSQALQKLDSGLFYLFDKTEALKDNVMLLSFEEQGLEKALKGEELRKFVQKKFSQYAVKYGKGQNIGLYQSDWTKTLLQFGQYPIKDLVIALDKIKGVTKGDIGDAKYLAKYMSLSVLQGYIFSKVLGVRGFGNQTNTPIDLANDITEGKAGRSPVISLLLGLGSEITADQENEQDFDKQSRRREITRAAGTMTIPASNQLLFKTGKYAQNLNRGNFETLSGNVANEASDDWFSNLKGLAFGGSYDPKRQGYIKEGLETDEWPSLSKKESSVYRSLTDKDEKTKYYEAKKGQPRTLKEISGTEEKKKGLFDFLKSDEEESGTAEVSEIQQFHFKKGDATSGDASVRKSAFNEVRRVFEDPELPDEYKQQVLEASGITENELEYYNLASMNKIDKRKGLVEFAGGDFENRDELVGGLALMKRTVAGNAIGGTNDYDYLYDLGYITKSEKKLLSAIKYDESLGKFYIDRDYKGSGLTASQQKAIINKINKVIDFSGGKRKSASSAWETLKGSESVPSVDPLALQPKRGTRTKDQWFDSY